MIAFIDDQRATHGVEPICKVLPIAPSTYFDHVAKRADPEKQSFRVKRDAVLLPEIDRVFNENFRVLRCSQGLAADGARALRCCPLHRRSPDAGDGT